MGKTRRGLGFFIILILICCIIGSFIGDIAKPYLPKFLQDSFSVGIGPFPLNLKFLSITFGMALNMNMISVLGLIIALILYLKYL